jgi:hypothetical protein
MIIYGGMHQVQGIAKKDAGGLRIIVVPDTVFSFCALLVLASLAW